MIFAKEQILSMQSWQGSTGPREDRGRHARAPRKVFASPPLRGCGHAIRCSTLPSFGEMSDPSQRPLRFVGTTDVPVRAVTTNAIPALCPVGDGLERKRP